MIKLLQVIPDAPYYIWQLYVQMLNFRNLGYEEHATILVGVHPSNSKSKTIMDFEQWTKAEVLYFPDNRTSRVYPSGLRPHVMKQYFEMMEKQDKEPHTYFYHDQDIIFTRAIDWSQMLDIDDANCYVSMAAHNYISWDYLMDRKQVRAAYIPYTMFEIVGIDPEVVKAQNKNTGGAQYLIKGLGSAFWDKVERDCENLYRYMQHAVNFGIREYKPHEENFQHNIQIWTADMWAVLWNIWLFKKETRWHTEIDFSWPWETTGKPVMHNAGITASNEFLKEKDASGVEKATTKPKYFNKSRFNGSEFPFGNDFSFVPKDCAQYQYVQLMNDLAATMPKLINANMTNSKRRYSILGVFCTTNKIHPDLLKLTLGKLKIAADSTQNADVGIVTCSWEPIPDVHKYADDAIVTPFKGMGHLNYILQIKQVLANFSGDIVCMLEHDVMYPPNYFDRVVEEWSDGKYGVTFDNYIGMNETGYQDVKERHQPMSLMSMAKFYLESNLNKKIDEALRRIDGKFPFGWCCVEPDNKDDFKRIPFTNEWPAIHVNMNHLGNWGTGEQGKNHHFTSHCEVCYEPDSKGKVDRPNDWGYYKDYFTFSS